LQTPQPEVKTNRQKLHTEVTRAEKNDKKKNESSKVKKPGERRETEENQVHLEEQDSINRVRSQANDGTSAGTLMISPNAAGNDAFARLD